MGSFANTSDGEVDDFIRLSLGGSEVKIAESYDITSSYLSQPSQFSLRLGSADIAADIINAARPNTRFQLQVGKYPQMTGTVDGFDVDSSHSGTTVAIHGRDVSAPLHDAYVDAETSFTDATYLALTAKVLKRAGITANVYGDNDSNRQIMTSTTVRTAGKPSTGGQVSHQVHAKLGERWLHFLRRHLDRAGLFITATAEGDFVLSRPNSKQPALARIVRKRGQPSEASNVTRARWRVDTSHRYSEVQIYSRAGGKKFGRGKFLSGFDDPAMAAYGITRPLVLRDKQCTNATEAEFMARRYIAQAGREGVRLEYTLRGHSAPSLISGGGRAVWAIDTMVEVDDDELGIHEPYWVESVHFNRPPTTTTISLVRVADLVFGADE